MIDLARRRTHIAVTTQTSHEAFMTEAARNLTDAGFLKVLAKLLVDRETKFTHGVHELLASGRVEPVFTPPKSPNCNAYAGRFIRSIK